MGKQAHTAQDRKRALVREAKALGFDALGVSQAGFLEEEADRLEEWLRRDYHGEMAYLARNVDKRLDPRKLVPGAKSVVSLLYNYHTDAQPTDPEAPRVARYAQGQDYHYVIKWKLKELMKWAQREWGEIGGRVFVDSAPVHERAWAAKSGLGWVGKNSLLLNQGMGSYFFIAELIIDVDLEPDAPTADHCGTCTRCIDACPTGAIIQSGVVDGSKCISYFTIELRGAIRAGAPAPIALGVRVRCVPGGVPVEPPRDAAQRTAICPASGIARDEAQGLGRNDRGGLSRCVQGHGCKADGIRRLDAQRPSGVQSAGYGRKADSISSACCRNRSVHQIFKCLRSSPVRYLMDFRSSRAKSFLLELTRSKTFLQRLSMSRVIVEVDGFNSIL